MINVPVITRRELHSLFLSPMAYIVLTSFALVQGILFANVLGPRIDPVLTSQWVTFGIPLYLLMAATPVLTMRLLSEETSSGTIETMMTAPVTEPELVLGKFAGVLVFAMVMFLPLGAQMAFLGMQGPMDVGAALAGFMGLFLLTAQFLSIGLLLLGADARADRGGHHDVRRAAGALLGLPHGRRLAGRARPAAGATSPRPATTPASRRASWTRGTWPTSSLTTALFLVLTVRALQLRKWR